MAKDNKVNENEEIREGSGNPPEGVVETPATVAEIPRNDSEAPQSSADDGKSMANGMANAMAKETGSDTDPETEPDTFPRDYVEKLRRENAGYRERAQKADDLAHRLHTALVEATGRLADARDLPYDETHLDDPQALSEAIEGLLADKPHLASRRPAGNIGQGATSATDTVDLAGLLRANAS